LLEIRLDLERRAEVGDRAVLIAGLKFDVGAIVEGDRVMRIVFDGGIVVGDRARLVAEIGL
jgi:hypothetical protein